MAHKDSKFTFKLDAVNSHDYWLFRKQHNDQTHQVVTQIKVVAEMRKRKLEPSFDNVIKVIRETWDNEKTAKSPSGSEDRQILQYLNQLSDKGINRLVNAIRYTLTSN
jgi:hypothetical protein